MKRNVRRTINNNAMRQLREVLPHVAQLRRSEDYLTKRLLKATLRYHTEDYYALKLRFNLKMDTNEVLGFEAFVCWDLIRNGHQPEQHLRNLFANCGEAFIRKLKKEGQLK